MSTHHSFTIRPAISRDQDAVLALVPRLRAFESSQTLREPEALDAGEQRTLRQFFAEHPAGCLLWVAEDRGAVVGMAYANQATDYFTQEKHGHLGILAVAGTRRVVASARRCWRRSSNGVATPAFAFSVSTCLPRTPERSPSTRRPSTERTSCAM